MTGDVPADAAEAFGRAQRFPDAAAGGFVYAVGGSPDDPRFYRMTPAGRWVDTIDTLPRGAVENGVSSQILYWNDDDRPHVASVTAPDGQRYATGAGGILRVRADGSLEPLTAEERAALPPEVGTRLLRQAAGPMLAMPDGVNGPFRRCTTCAPSRTPSRLGDLQPDEVERIQRVVERLSRDVRSEFPDHGVPVEISVVGSAARGARRNPGREDLPIGHDPVGRPAATSTTSSRPTWRTSFRRVSARRSSGFRSGRCRASTTFRGRLSRASSVPVRRSRFGPVSRPRCASSRRSTEPRNARRARTKVQTLRWEQDSEEAISPSRSCLPCAGGAPGTQSRTS